MLDPLLLRLDIGKAGQAVGGISVLPVTRSTTRTKRAMEMTSRAPVRALRLWALCLSVELGMVDGKTKLRRIKHEVFVNHDYQEH